METEVNKQKKLKDVTWEKAKGLAKQRFSRLKFEIKKLGTEDVVANVEIKIIKYPFPHVLIDEIEVENKLNGLNLRGQSTEGESGYGGTIIRQINEQLRKRKLFAVLKNKTEDKNTELPEVVDFYLKHDWEYFYPDSSYYDKSMYFVPNKDLISDTKFKVIKSHYFEPPA